MTTYYDTTSEKEAQPTTLDGVVLVHRATCSIATTATYRLAPARFHPGLVLSIVDDPLTLQFNPGPRPDILDSIRPSLPMSSPLHD